MTFDELKSDWETLYGTELTEHSSGDIKKIIRTGVSATVAELNKKLFQEIALTALAAVISTLGIVFFYVVYSPAQYPHINLSLIIPIQILGVTIFLILFLFSLLEFRLINKHFDASSVKQFTERTLAGFRKYYRLFNGVILTLVGVAYLLELRYIIAPTVPTDWIIIVCLAGLLTGLSYWIIHRYYQRHWMNHLQALEGYLQELKEKQS